MTYRFTARAVAAEIDPDNDVMTAGVAEDGDGGGFILLFMSNIGEPSRQNVSLGLDTHCLVTQDQGTAYGCVREITLSNQLLTVSLDPASLDDLGLEDAEIEAELDVPDEDIERMREVLAQVLAFGRVDAHPRRVEL
ncbi:Imm10 family immunity protein [Streptomyces sp. NBC_00576]|uniref:Imm10 family immunity protein n=1 Tax=Streptomyces sp. NBC_00576 TaxID=2903665 RepID=UPI002E81D78C|nr:Imm10 family immunity protein [Streptomyces sp. NBC_00576]WUB73318.1 Imm10 family immunity protein [Streptomyces sp. NBC_00576]